MAQPYLTTLEDLIAGELGGIAGLVCKHFFSGAALYMDAKICATLTFDGFAFKLPEQRCIELIESGKASPLRYFENSPIKRGYVLIADAGSTGDAALISYFKECVAHASSSSVG